MTFAAIDWLSISINLLLVVFVIVCLLMTLLILMQRPKQEGLGAAFGGGVTDQVFGARTTNVLQKGTVYLGSLFFILALVLAILIGHQNKDSETLNQGKPAEEEAAPETPTSNETPATDPESLSGDLPSSLLEELETPAAPEIETQPPAETTEETPGEDAPSSEGPANEGASEDEAEKP